MSGTAERKSKRKSDAGDAGTSKKPRLDASHPEAVALINDILADSTNYMLPEEDDEIKDSMIALAKYAQALQQQLAQAQTAKAPAQVQAGPSAAPAPPKKSAEQLADAAEKIRRAAQAGIKKQMAWKPSCKTGTAKWSYDGICPDPDVFGVLMGLNGPPTFKMKKYTVQEFENLIGQITKDIRYDRLSITGSHVNVRWMDSGEFKFSGSYGK